MIRIASFIVDKRMLFFLIYIIALIFSVIATNWVKVNFRKQPKRSRALR